MTYVLLFVAVIALFYIKSQVFKRIDEKEARVRNTPHRADRLRDNFSGLVEELQSITDWGIARENVDQVILGDMNGEYLAIQPFSGKLCIAYVNHKQVIQEWQLPFSTSVEDIVSKVKPYIQSH